MLTVWSAMYIIVCIVCILLASAVYVVVMAVLLTRICIIYTHTVVSNQQWAAYITDQYVYLHNGQCWMVAL